MKQNLFNKLWLRVGMIVAIMTTALSGTAWADEVVAYTLAPASGSNNSYAGNCDITINNITWNLTGNSTYQPWRIGGKSLNGVDRTLYSKTAITDNVSKIEVTHGAASSITVNSWTVIVSKNSDFSNPVSTLTPTFEASKTTTITRPDGVDWSNCYYKFVYNVSVSGDKNKFVEFTEAKFYKETGTVLTESDLSLSPTSLSFDLYNDKDSKTITCTTSSTGNITVSASDYVETTVSENTITVTPVKATLSPQTITVNQAADESYAAGEKTFTVTISNSTPATVYEKVTNANQLVAGNEYILVASTSTKSYAMGSMGTNLRSSVEVTVNDDAVSIQGEPIAVLTLGGISGAWTFLASDNDEYLAYSGNSNQLHSNSDASEAASTWVVTDDFQLESANVTGRYLQYNAGSPRFACYTGSQTDAYLYVKQGSPINTKVAPGFSFSADFAQANLGEAFTAPTFSNPNNVTVTFASSEPSVATISDAGVVTILAVGTTVISATSVEDENYEAGTASYTLTVVDPNAPGSVNNPYTVAEAIAAYDAAGANIEDVYVTGIVCTASSNLYNNKYLSYYISDDGTTNSSQLEAYNGLGLNGANFTSVDDVQVGDVVVIYGTLTYYANGSKYEMAANNHLVSLDRPEKPKHTVSFSVNGTVTSTDEVSEQSTITFPADPADVEGKTFMGWTTEEISGTTDTAPTIVTSAVMGIADVTYYAVFATATSGGSSQESLEITATTVGVPSSYGTANTFTEYTLEGVKFQIQQMYKNGGKLQWRAAGNDSGTGTMYNSESLGKIESIVLTYNSSDNNKNFTLKVGNSANPTEGETITPSSSDEVYTFDCSSFNYGFFVMTNGSGAGYVDNIVINYSASSITYSAYCTTVAPATESVTVTDAGYATFASDNALDFTGSSIKAFYATESAAGTLSFTQVNKVPADTGVLLYAAGGATVDVPVFTGEADAVTGNVFVRGAGAKVTYAENDQNYILFNGDDGIGFYRANNNNVAKNRAYIHVTSGSGNGVKSFAINLEDDATGISLMEDGRSQMEDGVIYNVAGQRINKLQKGINIVNGKKIAVK